MANDPAKEAKFGGGIEYAVSNNWSVGGISVRGLLWGAAFGRPSFDRKPGPSRLQLQIRFAGSGPGRHQILSARVLSLDYCPTKEPSRKAGFSTNGGRASLGYRMGWWTQQVAPRGLAVRVLLPRGLV